MSIEVKNITKLYGEQRALSDVSLSIGEGCVVGLLGPNGAGKSTLMKVITGSVRPDSGTVSVCGLDISEHPLQVRRLLGYLPEHNPLYTDMYVREYLTMVAGQYGIANVEDRVEELISETGLTPEAHKKIGALSKGYRQRVGISQALIGNPRVVILDEPTTGLDPNQIVEMRSLIRRLAKDRTVVLSTHIMQEVEAVCDRLVIIDRGVIRAQGTVEQVLAMAAPGQVVDVVFDGGIDAAHLAKSLSVKVDPMPLGPSASGMAFRVTAPATDDDLRIRLFRYAVGLNTPLLHLAEVQEDIEDVFHRLTQK